MNTIHIKISDFVAEWGLSGRSITLAVVMNEYRMDCNKDIEMHEPGCISRTRTTGSDITFPVIKPCFLIRKFYVLLPGSWEKVFV